MNTSTPYRPFRRLCAFVVLLLIVYNAAGHLVVFTAIRHAVQREVKALLKQGVPESDLHVLVIPMSVEYGSHSSFRRIHAGEFRYEGRLYDIVRKEVQGDTTIYYCINDTEEEKLFADLDERVRAALPSSSAAKGKSSLAALKLLIKEAMTPATFTTILPFRLSLPTGTIVHAVYTITPEIPTPPPRPVVSYHKVSG